MTGEWVPEGNVDLTRIVAHLEIGDVLVRYCQGVDRRDWERVLSCYHPDAHDSHGMFAGSPAALVEWMQGNHEHVSSCMHVLTNVRIEVSTEDPSLARAESYCHSHKIITSAEHDPFLCSSGVEGAIHRTIACRFVDTFENRPGVGWRILDRAVVYEWARIDPGDAFVAMDPSLTYSRRDTGDALYAPLSRRPDGPR